MFIKQLFFYGSNFQENDKFPTDTNELLKSKWRKLSTRAMFQVGNASSVCWFHYLFSDPEKKTKTLGNIASNVSCEAMSDELVVHTLNEWSTQYFLNVSNMLKAHNFILVNPILSLSKTKLGLNVLNSKIRLSKSTKFPNQLFRFFG